MLSRVFRFSFWPNVLLWACVASAVMMPAVGWTQPGFPATGQAIPVNYAAATSGCAPGGCAPGGCATGDCASCGGCVSGDPTIFGRLGCQPICTSCGTRIVTGVDSARCVGCGEPTWMMRGPVPWEVFAQGEYIGPHRQQHTPEYRLRVDDELLVVFRVTRDRTARAYELNVGDQIRVESLADENLDRELEIQPDGTITVRLIGQVLAAGRTIDEVRRDLEKRYKKFYRVPSITVTPIRVNTKLEDIRATVDSRQGFGGQQFPARVSPDGTIQLPAIGPVPAQGLSLTELKKEIDARYDMIVEGLEATPTLSARAPRFIYVVGEVGEPGRFDLVGPTTVMQAVALAGGWNVGANLRQIVVFRRAEDWRLIATKIDVRGALYGKRPAPADEIWLRDSDVVLIPKSPVRTATDAIQLVFTDGVYSVAPFLADAFFYIDDTVVTGTGTTP